MGITLTRDSLLSRAVRSRITGSGLTRVLNIAPALASNQDDSSGSGGGIVQRIFGGLFSWGQRFAGFLSAIIKGVSFTASGIFSMLVSVATELSTFDWAASDNEINGMIKGNNLAIASTWGGLVGSGLGWTVGIGIGYGISVLCPVIGSAKLAQLISGKVALEALEEVGATAVSTLQTTAALTGKSLLLAGYKRFRRLLGKNPPDSAPSWTIAGKFEEKIEGIKNEYLRAFVENAADEFFDSFVESGYIFAYELDAQLAAARAANAGGIERTVRITPDKRTPGESLILVGPEEKLKQDVQIVLNQHRLIHNRDVGQIIGQPAEDWIRAQPQRRKMVIVFKELKQPPYSKEDGSSVRTAVYTIPDPKTGLSWEQIKKAAKAFNWGRFRYTAHLDNGRQMAVYGASPQEAEDKLQDLLALTSCRILSGAIAEEKEKATRLKKRNTRLYPATGCLVVRRDTSDDRANRPTLSAALDEEFFRFDLWPDEEPEDFKQYRL